MAFRTRWRELKQVGWTSKRPTELSNDFIYIRPGKSNKDMRGQDFFVGEEELMAYLDQIDLAELDAEKQAESNAQKQQARDGTDQNSTTDAGSVLEAIQQTPVQPTADPGVSQRRQHERVIEGVSPHDTTVNVSPDASNESSHALCPPSRRNLDPDFVEADEPDSSLDDTSLVVQSGPDEESKEEDDSVANASEDANILTASDDPHEFSVLDSDGENDDGSARADDDFVEVNEEEETMSPPELRFDERLGMSVGGLESVISGQISTDFWPEMAAHGWSALETQTPYPYLMEPYETRPPDSMQEDYPHLYTGNYGPTPAALKAAAPASGSFFYFAQPALWDDIAAASEEYFQEKIDERVEGQYEKQVARERKHPGYTKKNS